jgi:pilus assembly protein CpaB
VRPQSIAAVVLALVFGGSAAVGVRQYTGAGTTPREVVQVVVAKMNIPRGMLVTADQIKTREYPKEVLPAEAILKTDDVMDRSTLTPIVKDEPLLESKLSPKGQRGLASVVAEGMRAFTINTNVASGVAGFILPGNKVDVLLTVASGANDMTGGGVTTTLLQNVEILAVDQRVEAPAENKVNSNELRSVTLLVTPSQAAKLSLGQNKGTLYLALRNPKDESPARTRPTTVFDIQLGSEPPSKAWDERAKDLMKAWGEAMAKRAAATPPPLPAAEPARKTIRTIRGSLEGLVNVTPLDSSG